MKKVVMTFQDVAGMNFKLSVDNAKSDLTNELVKTAMESIIADDVFATKNGALSTIVDAAIIETIETDLNVEG